MTLLRIAILEDEQGVIDGYHYRLAHRADFKIVLAARTGSELEAQLDGQAVDLLLLDLSVPAAPDNPRPYPISAALPRLRARHPGLAVVVVSNTADPIVIQLLIESGINGYLVKADAAAYDYLADILHMAARRELFLSTTAHAALRPPADNVPSPVTPRQRELLALCAAYPDENYTELARRLGVTASTVRNQMSEIYQRLGVRSRQSAVEEARRRGLV